MHVNVIWKAFRRDGVKWRKDRRDGVMRDPAWGATENGRNPMLQKPSAPELSDF